MIIIRWFLIIVFILNNYQSISAQQQEREKKYHAWWNDLHAGTPLKSPLAKKLPLIKVKDNRFVDSLDRPLLFRGLSISDPDKIANQGFWNKKHFEKIKEMGTMIIRIPVHPIAWRERTPAKYLELLDQAVEWCSELDMYIIIDWHSIGNLKMGLFQNPMYNTSLEETNNFWRTIAWHFTGNNTVAFYEIFNEPTFYFGQLGQMSWSEWKKINEDIINLIRAYDKETIPLVAGFDWAYDLTPLLVEPIQAEGIGYVTHPYPQKRSKPWEPKWEENFGFAAHRYPIIATEIGFTLGKEGFADNSEYGNMIVNFLEERNISWLAWVFDHEWYPSMIESVDTYKLTECGEFFKQAMNRIAEKEIE